jgi:hypothetical protein
MRIILRRALALTALAVAAAAFAGIGTAVAADDGQLVDISHQVAAMQKKLDDMASKGRTARSGKLAQLADCGFGEPSQVFAPWGDDADYSVAPQGDLSSTSAWSLKNVDVAAAHDPFTAGTNSLVFTKGDSQAVTPVMCVTQDNPTLRVFVADLGGNGKAHLDVTVLYEDLGGATHELNLARLKVDDAWQPSVVIPIGVNMLSAASTSGWTPVAFSFKVHGLQKDETFVLDGVYVDPYRSR